MRQRRGIAAWSCAVALGIAPGCVAARHRREAAAESPAVASARQEMSQAATAAIDRGDYDRARADLETLTGQSPRSAELHYRLGRVLQLQGDFGAAADAYRKALAIEPGYVGALVGMGQLDARLGRPVEALKRFDEAIEVEPHRAEAHFARGLALEALSRADEALAAYFRSLELDPDSPAAVVRVAGIQLGRGHADQALVRLNRANELAPDDPEVRFRRGQALLALKDVKAAVNDLNFAAGKLDDRADVLISLAQALEIDGQPAQARGAAERALRLSPDSALARDLSGRLQR